MNNNAGSNHRSVDTNSTRPPGSSPTHDESAERRARLEDKQRRLAELKASRESRKQGIDADKHQRPQQQPPRRDLTPPRQEMGAGNNIVVQQIVNNIEFQTANKVRPSQLEIVSGPLPISIPPKMEAMSFCKTTQTDDRFSIGEFSTGSQEDMAFDEMSLDEENALLSGLNDESPSHEIRKHLKNLHFLHNTHLDSIQETPQQATHQQQCISVPNLSEDEKRKIFSAPDFLRFFERQSRVIERALDEEYDIFTDYFIGSDDERPKKQDTGELLVLKRKISDPSALNRRVNAFSFSSFHPELFAVAHDCLEDAKQNQSIVNVWNMKLKASPEMMFHNSSPVTALCYDEFQPNVLIGGCYSGQICIWDSRANKRVPSLKTPLSQNAHTMPVYCMQMVGTTNAHDLVTVSTDGRICSWSPSNLQNPIEQGVQISKNKKPITALCMSFLDNDINTFVIGSEEGELYVAERHGNKEVARSFSGHQLPVTSVDMHPGSRATIDFSSLCISSSLDFSLRLWNLKDLSLHLPLLTLDREHKFFVSDVKWSPVHPAVFASATACGQLCVWNLNENMEHPLITLQPSETINKLLWSRKGQQLVVGDDAGNVFIYDVHESLYNPRNAEWENFARVVAELNEAAQQQQRELVTAPQGTMAAIGQMEFA